ncbi:MAG: DUF4383 domain-containing protein [Thermoplasmatota archaeon]
MNKMVGMVFGVVLIVVGLLGFVITPTLILFGVNTLHNVIHLASGVALLAGALMMGGKNARMINGVFGVVYLLVAVVGFAMPAVTNSLLASNSDSFMYADAALHAVLGLLLLGSALAFKSETAMPA